DGHQAGLILKGFVGVGESGRGSRNHQSFFINGRYMKSSILSAAVEAACRERVLSGKYPTCVLHLTMPYDTVDVNVHPNKLEVRFQNEAAVAEAVEAIVTDALADKAPVEQPDVLRLTPEPPPTVPVTVVRQPVTASETAQPEATVPPKVEKKPTVGMEIPQKAAIPAKNPPIPTPSTPAEKPSEPPHFTPSLSFESGTGRRSTRSAFLKCASVLRTASSIILTSLDQSCCRSRMQGLSKPRFRSRSAS
ncbi:MAG TPA: hypothetical protein DHV94_10715, partial [Clostridiales bacterium]|nr:hypothetical protein [Clostridiales bacterium]